LLEYLKYNKIKVIPLDRMTVDQKFLELLKREIEIMQKIDNPNVVKMFAASRTSRNLYMFLEYCRDGDLKSLLKKNGGRLSESEVFFLVTIFRRNNISNKLLTDLKFYTTTILFIEILNQPTFYFMKVKQKSLILDSQEFYFN
jgi:hypothetical protein